MFNKKYFKFTSLWKDLLCQKSSLTLEIIRITINIHKNKKTIPKLLRDWSVLLIVAKSAGATTPSLDAAATTKLPRKKDYLEMCLKWLAENLALYVVWVFGNRWAYMMKVLYFFDFILFLLKIETYLIKCLWWFWLTKNAACVIVSAREQYCFVSSWLNFCCEQDCSFFVSKKTMS